MTAAWRSPRPPAARALQDPVSAPSPCPRTTTNGPPLMAASERWNTQKLVGASDFCYISFGRVSLDPMQSPTEIFCQHCFVLTAARSMHLGSEADSAGSVSCPSASPQSQQQIILNDPLTQAC